MSATGVRVDSRGSSTFSAEAFDKALNDAIGQPGDEAPWRRLEEAVAADEAQARGLLDVYRAQLATDLPRPLHEVLAHRAVRFAADCFGENAPESIDVLRAVLAAAPDADWAFRPLVVALTMAERWTDVLDAYDARLAAARATSGAPSCSPKRPASPRTSRATAGAPSATSTGCSGCVRMDAQVASSLERLLERDRRWASSAPSGALRLEGLTGEEAREQRLRLATTLHAELGQPDDALEVLRPLLDGARRVRRPSPSGWSGSSSTSAPRPRRAWRRSMRCAAGCDAAGRAAHVAELLAVAIGFSTGEAPAGAAARVRRAAARARRRRGRAGPVRGPRARWSPEDREIEDRLRQLAELGGDPAALARGLHGAARATATADERRVELLMRAARVEDRQLGRKAEAAALFAAATAESAAPLDAHGWRRCAGWRRCTTSSATWRAGWTSSNGWRRSSPSRPTSAWSGRWSRSWRAGAATSIGRSAAWSGAAGGRCRPTPRRWRRAARC